VIGCTKSSGDSDVAIIGAGPYGLSVAAHLCSRNIEFRIFGVAMGAWRTNMPPGMFLKSEGCASNLSDPLGLCTLEQYCANHYSPYAACGVPIPIDLFTRYGLWFQQSLVPTIEEASVRLLDRSGSGFRIDLGTGETFRARRVVVATGISNTAYVPPVLAHLPSELASHSSEYQKLNVCRGREITVVGAGQSALETAALLHEGGAQVQLVARRPEIRWNPPPCLARRPLRQRLERPSSHLGEGLGPWFYSNAPMVFRYLPSPVRISRVRKSLGPAGAWWLKDRAAHRFEIMTGYSVAAAECLQERVMLRLKSTNGTSRDLTTDHVIAATGYRFALQQLPFLTKPLLSELRSVAQAPILSSNFESSIPDLYFTGLASANQFGPVMRFLDGADYTAQCISRHIAGLRRVALVSLPARHDIHSCTEN
jgi:hypothetical protein